MDSTEQTPGDEAILAYCKQDVEMTIALEKASRIAKLRRLWNQFADPEYRHAYALASVGDMLAVQIWVNRNDRGLTKRELATLTGLTRARIKALESSADDITLNELSRIASALDVAIHARLISFKELAEGIQTGGIDRVSPPYQPYIKPEGLTDDQ